MESLKPAMEDLQKLDEVFDSLNPIRDLDLIKGISIDEINLGEGLVHTSFEIEESLYYDILKEITGYNISGDHQILALITQLANTKKEYDKIEIALNDAKDYGYGFVSPTLDELELAEPEIFRQGNRFGVRLKATAPSLHIMKANIDTEVAPLIGSEKQSEELLEYFLSEFESDPSKIWSTNLFGKSLNDLVTEQLSGKLTAMPEDARNKMRRALEKIANDGNSGLILIII